MKTLCSAASLASLPTRAAARRCGAGVTCDKQTEGVAAPSAPGDSGQIHAVCAGLCRFGQETQLIIGGTQQTCSKFTACAS